MKTPPKLILVTLENSSFDKELLDMIKKQILERIPELDRNVSYTAKQMCGKEFWKPLSKTNKIHAGECVSFLVNSRVLPLVLTGLTRSNANKYRLN